MTALLIEVKKMLSNTTGCERQRTISYGLKGRRGRYSLGAPPPADNVSHDLSLLGRRFGWLEIISTEKRYSTGWHGAYVATRCTGCGASGWTNYANLRRGKSRGCQSCSARANAPPYPNWLRSRVEAMRDRCTNPDNKGWKNYGGRGIEFRFPSTRDGAIWIMQNLGLHRDLDIDRENNNGHYEPGNLRYLTRSQNMHNQRRSKITQADSDWADTSSPLGKHATRRYLAAGYPKESIIGLAYKSVLDKRKNWRGIRDRLVALGYTI